MSRRLKFGDEPYIKQALMEKGRTIRLIQSPKGERDAAATAASILARDVFVRQFEEMCEAYGIDFPKGAAHVEETAVGVVETHGEEMLEKVAKTSFATTTRILREARRRRHERREAA